MCVIKGSCRERGVKRRGGTGARGCLAIFDVPVRMIEVGSHPPLHLPSPSLHATTITPSLDCPTLLEHKVFRLDDLSSSFHTPHVYFVESSKAMVDASAGPQIPPLPRSKTLRSGVPPHLTSGGGAHPCDARGGMESGGWGVTHSHPENAGLVSCWSGQCRHLMAC